MKLYGNSRHPLSLAAIATSIATIVTIAMANTTSAFEVNPQQTATIPVSDLKILDINGKVLYQAKKAHTLEEAILEAYNADADLSGANFSGLTLTHLQMPFCRLAKMAGADFSRSQLIDCNIDADFHGAKFTDATLVEVDLGGNLMSTDFRRVNKNFTGSTFSLMYFKVQALSDADIAKNAALLTKQEVVIRDTSGKVIYKASPGITLTQAVNQACKNSVNLTNADFRNSYFSNANFVGQSSDKKLLLSGADFSNSYFLNCKFENVELKDANFKETALSHCHWDECRFETDLCKEGNASRDNGASVRLNGPLNNADFSDANLAGSSIGGGSLSNAKFVHANLSNAKLTSLTFADADFTDANMSNTTIYNGTLFGARFNHCDLSSTHLINCLGGNRASLRHTNSKVQKFPAIRNEKAQNGVTRILSTNNKVLFVCEASSLEDALSKACAKHVSLRKANLSFCQTNHPITFAQMDLSGADFTGADLSGVQFQDCNLAGAKFENTKMFPEHTSIPCGNVESSLMTNCNLKGAKLIGADCRARIITNCNLTDAEINACYMTQTLFVNCKLDKAKIASTNFTGGRFDDSSLKETTITACTLSTDSFRSVHDSKYTLDDVGWVNIRRGQNGTLEFVSAASP